MNTYTPWILLDKTKHIVDVSIYVRYIQPCSHLPTLAYLSSSTTQPAIIPKSAQIQLE